MSDATPSDYSGVYVRVRTRARASLHTVAHYKTTDTERQSGHGPYVAHAADVADHDHIRMQAPEFG